MRIFCDRIEKADEKLWPSSGEECGALQQQQFDEHYHRPSLVGYKYQARCLLTFLFIISAIFILFNRFEERINPICQTELPEFKQSLAMQARGLPRLSNWTGTVDNATIDNNATWRNIFKHYNNIWKETMERLRPMQMHEDESEVKYFTNFLRPYLHPDCNIVTLGVGGSIDTESQILTKYPQCRFLSIDPVSEGNEGLYSKKKWPRKQWRFVQGAVSGKGGVRTAFFRQADGIAKLMSLQHLSIAEFLEQYNGNRTIDLLLMDVEGAEYGIIEKLSDGSSNLPNICQTNIEFHFPPITFDETFERFFQNLEAFISRGYALVHVDFYEPVAFLRAYFVNHVDDQCVQKFLCSKKT